MKMPRGRLRLTFWLLVFVFFFLIAVRPACATTEEELITAITTRGTVNLVVDSDIVLTLGNLPLIRAADLTIQGTCSPTPCQIDGKDLYSAFRNPRRLTIIDIEIVRAAPAIHSKECNAIVNLRNCRITSNLNQASNGAVYVASGRLKIENSVFYANSAVNGGAIYLARGATLVANRVTFRGNVAAIAGGAIVCIDSVMECNHCSFIANRASQYGGAVALMNRTAARDSNAYFYTSSFSNNSVRREGSQGGAVYVGHVDGKLDFCRCSFAQNTAEWNRSNSIAIRHDHVCITLSPEIDPNGFVYFCPSRPTPGVVVGSPSFDSRVIDSCANC